MDSREESRTPRPVEGVDWRNLPIGPTEAYILSRVDGFTSETDLIGATGLDSDSVRQALDRLRELGAIDFDGKAPERVRQRASADPGTQARVRLSRPVIEAHGADGASAAHPAAALYDPGELDEEVDLDLPRRRQILDLYYRLDSLTHYELFDISTDSDKRAVKSAYFAIVALYHPDRYFGKRLGSFKPKLERIFRRLTEAHDVLARQAQRDDYDAYLNSQRKTRDLDRLLSDDQARAAEVERVRRQIEEQARLEERVVNTTPVPRALDNDARRKMLARKLGRSISPPRPTSVEPAAPAISQEAIREKVADDLRRRYQDRALNARHEQVQHYVKAAERALEQKDRVSAVNALRIAASLAPDDQTIVQRLEETQLQASADLADNYIEQAAYEERSGRYAEAARSYERALRGKSTPRLYDRAAFCILQSQGDLKLAGEHAKKAVALAPNEATLHVTLARVYLAAGMKTSAQNEFERAAQLAPNDDSIKDWLKRLRRGEI
jgi:tetratricopeptide (TPR) repeat protein